MAKPHDESPGLAVLIRRYFSDVELDLPERREVQRSVPGVESGIDGGIVDPSVGGRAR